MGSERRRRKSPREKGKGHKERKLTPGCRILGNLGSIWNILVETNRPKLSHYVVDRASMTFAAVPQPVMHPSAVSLVLRMARHRAAQGGVAGLGRLISQAVKGRFKVFGRYTRPGPLNQAHCISSGQELIASMPLARDITSSMGRAPCAIKVGAVDTHAWRCSRQREQARVRVRERQSMYLQGCQKVSSILAWYVVLT